jgi:TonB family protein
MQGFLANPEPDHAGVLHRLQEKISAKTQKRFNSFPIWALAAAMALLFAAVWFFKVQPVPDATHQMAQDLPPVDTERQQETAPEPGVSAQAQEKRLDAYPQPAKPQESLRTTVDKAIRIEDDGASNAGMAAADNKESAKPAYGASADEVKEQSTNVALPTEEAEARATRAMKKAAPAPVPTETKKTKAKAATLEPVPAEGWEALRAYLSKNARLTPEAKANNATGTVKLEFELDAKQQPVNFKVLKSVGFGCDEAAIQLVKQVAWKGAPKNTILVDVPFVR